MNRSPESSPRNPLAGNSNPGRLSAFKPALELRAKTLQAMRAFFQARDFLEVETPVRIQAPALELHIDAEPAGDEDGERPLGLE